MLVALKCYHNWAAKPAMNRVTLRLPLFFSTWYRKLIFLRSTIYIISSHRRRSVRFHMISVKTEFSFYPAVSHFVRLSKLITLSTGATKVTASRRRLKERQEILVLQVKHKSKLFSVILIYIYFRAELRFNAVNTQQDVTALLFNCRFWLQSQLSIGENWSCFLI